MDYVIAILIIFSMIILGTGASHNPIVKLIGSENAHANKAKENVRNSWICLGDVVAIFVASRWLHFLRWPILVFHGAAFLWGLFVNLLFPAIAGFFLHVNEKEDWYCLLGSLFQSIAGATILLLCMHRCFGWI